jgi:hypothetical protein
MQHFVKIPNNKHSKDKCAMQKLCREVEKVKRTPSPTHQLCGEPFRDGVACFGALGACSLGRLEGPVVLAHSGPRGEERLEPVGEVKATSLPQKGGSLIRPISGIAGEMRPAFRPSETPGTGKPVAAGKGIATKGEGNTVNAVPAAVTKRGATQAPPPVGHRDLETISVATSPIAGGCRNMLLKHAQFLCFRRLFQLFEDLQLNVLIFLDLASTGKPVADTCIIVCGILPWLYRASTGKPVAEPIVLTCVNTFELSICISDNACLVYQQIFRFHCMYICVFVAQVN